MKKIPVGATVAHAYRFAFGQFFNLLKLLWLPFLTLLAGNAVLTPSLTALSQAWRTHDYSTVPMPWPALVALAVPVWILSFMLITAVFQFALEQPEVRDRAFYFSFAAPLWRLIGATFSFLLALVGLLIVYLLAVILVLFLFRLGLGTAHVSADALKGIITLDVALAFLAGYCGAIFCWLRFGFLLAAVTIAEGRIGLFRSWTLSHGNFWRMFAIFLGIFLPFMLGEFALFYAAGLFPHIVPGESQAQIQAAQNVAVTRMYAGMQHYWYVVYPGGVVVALLMYGLMAGAAVFAYRALTDGEASTNLP